MYGNNTSGYTTDSDIPAALVHAGLLQPGQSGMVTFTTVGVLTGFSGNTAHGVTSRDYSLAWCGMKLTAVYTPPITPSVGLVLASANTETEVAGQISSDTAGTAYYTAVASGGSAPTAANLFATGSQQVVAAGQNVTLRATGLQQSTTYSLYAMVRNGAGINSTVQTVSASTGRNAYSWPFASNSIWNTPIGSGAQYTPANLPARPSASDPLSIFTPMPGVDQDIIVLRPTAPLKNIYLNTAGFTTGGNRCNSSPSTTTTVLGTVPIPGDFIVPNANTNNAAAFLLADARTLVQLQPITRCVQDDNPTAEIMFLRSEDLYGTGITGAHGGSFLSALGGTIRLGELRPTLAPPRHVLKIDVDTREVFPPCPARNQCYRWPALDADSNAVTQYGSIALPGVSSAMKMGALLAIPASVNINSLGLETDAAKKLAWTLQNYGAYIVDSTGGPAYNIAVEYSPDGSFLTQFQSDWGFAFNQRLNLNTAWVRDFQKLMVQLNVVTNNGPASIGGGGTPLQPLAVPLTAPSPIRQRKKR